MPDEMEHASVRLGSGGGTPWALVLAALLSVAAASLLTQDIVWLPPRGGVLALGILVACLCLLASRRGDDNRTNGGSDDGEAGNSGKERLGRDCDPPPRL